MLKIQAGIFYNGNDIAWKRDVGEAKQVFNNKNILNLKNLIDCAVFNKKYIKFKNQIDCAVFNDSLCSARSCARRRSSAMGGVTLHQKKCKTLNLITL